MGRRETFFKNAAVLTAATLLLRVIGMVFRIVIAGRLGAQGMGLYQVVLSVYMLAATLGSAGLSMSVTRLVSEEQIRTCRDGIRRMMAFCITVAAILGAVVGAGLYAAAGILASGWIREPSAAVSLRVLALALPFMGVSAVLRGYFTARRRLGFTSLSQLLEQGVKFAACMGFIALWGVPDAAFGCLLVMAADTVSEWFSFAFQLAGYGADSRRLPLQGTPLPRTPSVGQRLWEIAAPIAGVRIISSALYTVENTLVPNLLAKAGTDAAHGTALAQWGQLKGMAIPVLMFPSTLLASFVLLLVPELCEYRARGAEKQAGALVALALRLTLAASVGVAAGLYLLAGPLCQLVYPGQGIDFYVRVLAPLVPFMYLENVTEGMLKGLGEQRITLTYSLVNVAVRIVLILLLVPRWGMRGFLWMMLVDNVVTSLLHTQRVLTVMQLPMDWRHWVLRPLVAAAVSGTAGVWLVQRLAGRAAWLRLSAGGGIMAAVYAAAVLSLGVVTREDLRIFSARKRSARREAKTA